MRRVAYRTFRLLLLEVFLYLLGLPFDLVGEISEFAYFERSSLLHQEFEVGQGVLRLERVQKSDLRIPVSVELDEAREVEDILGTSHLLVYVDRVGDSPVREPPVELIDRMAVEEFNEDVYSRENFFHLLDLGLQSAFQHGLLEVVEGLGERAGYLSFNSHMVVEDVVASLQKHGDRLIAVEV